jgi:DNA mismatch repair protein MutS2
MKEKTIKVLEFDKILEILKKKAETDLGREYLKKSRVLSNINEIRIKQKETSEGITLIMEKGNPPLSGVASVKDYVKRAELGGTLSAAMLLKVGHSLRASRVIRNYIKSSAGTKVGGNIRLLSKMAESLIPNKVVEEAITNAIISEEEISDNASYALKSIRKSITNKNSVIRNRLSNIVSTLSAKKYLQDAIVTIRNDRHVVPVKQEYRHQVKGLIHDQSSTGATLFIEPMAIVELNNELSTLMIDEKKEIERILAELTDLVGAVSEEIKSNEILLGELDFIFAKSKLSLQFNCFEPVLNDEGYIDIKKGRHPLIPKNEVVPTDIWLGKEFRTLIITGPNTGGKTVCLKTIGLFTLMAQFGLHIPAKSGSQIGVFNNVFADIGDEQSIEQSLSTFSSHMTNIVEIFNEIEDNSLVLLDEVGAGTDPVEGAALATSILEELHGRNVVTAATTHYSELKIYALTRDGVINGSVEFDVETLSPTYKVLIGVPGKSNAFEISKKLGLNEFIIDDARNSIEKNDVQFEDALIQIERDRKEIESTKEEILKLKNEQKNLSEKLKVEEEKIKKRKERIVDEAKAEAKEILENVKKDTGDMVSRIEKYNSIIDKESRKDVSEIKSGLNKKIKELSRTEYILETTNDGKPINKGDYVYIKSLNQKGYVLTKPNDDGKVTVQAGIMKLNVPVNTLVKTESEEEKSSQKAKNKMYTLKSKNIKTSIDLRGMNLEEAFLEIDKYLDDAYLSGLNEVQIIHGKGTGVLRKGITELLRTHRLVTKHRLGEFGEGGTGVTVVTLKN